MRPLVNQETKPQADAETIDYQPSGKGLQLLQSRVRAQRTVGLVVTRGDFS